MESGNKEMLYFISLIAHRYKHLLEWNIEHHDLVHTGLNINIFE